MAKDIVILDKIFYNTDVRFWDSISDKVELKVIPTYSSINVNSIIGKELGNKWVIVNDVVVSKSIKEGGVNSEARWIWIDSSPEYGMGVDEVERWLGFGNTYLISMRYFSIGHPNSITSLIYLPILYMFHRMNFSSFPMLDYSPPQNPKWDFSAYMGLVDKVKKRGERLETLNGMFGGDLNRVKLEDGYGFVADNKFFQLDGIGHWWNLLNSLSSKVNLVFETNLPTMKYNNYSFLTEKTTKTFLLPHPYWLLFHPSVLEGLEKYGFRFPTENKTGEFSKVRENIHKWVEDNREIFIHNQKNLYSLGSSISLPHHSFLKKLFKINDII